MIKEKPENKYYPFMFFFCLFLTLCCLAYPMILWIVWTDTVYEGRVAITWFISIVFSYTGTKITEEPE